MNLKRVTHKLISKYLGVRVSVFHWYLRSRNHRIVSQQPVKFKHFEEEVVFPDSQVILRLARECHAREGYYPISFSWPRNFNGPQNFKSNAVSEIVPYAPYSFDSEEKYYQNYESSILAVTQKKGGWDCFRHLEIIGAGCVPLFLNVERIPEYTMIHYPKEFLGIASRKYWKLRLLPSDEITRNLIAYANRTMTTEAMCRYFSSLSSFDIGSSDVILFVDSRLSTDPDYLSVMNFIGLKQVYGDQIHSLFKEPDYVYVDTPIDVADLYGRGFGYTKVLSRGRSPLNLKSSPKIVLLSNLERDFSLIDNLKDSYPNSKFVLFWGADRPIPPDLKNKVLLIEAILFSREIY